MRVCPRCQCYLGTGRNCWLCLNERSRIKIQVWSARSRARKWKEPATLTHDEWQITLKAFDYKCAYCESDDLKTAGLVVEHFIPLGMGAGSTRINCVPACERCNIKKRNHRPMHIPAHLIPPSSIERIYNYLQSIS
jgi:5-methylcytosine-specific restriction endonuclease McrA